MKAITTGPGSQVLEASDWNDFLSFTTEQLEYKHFVWRGQSEGTWALEPTLDRVIKRAGKLSYEKLLSLHLKRFKYAVRGRRGPTPRDMPSENDWWALGQHHGLATPLLDWTSSPFVAAFFAYAEENSSSTGFRALFGLSKTSCEIKSAEIAKAHSGKTRPPILEFVEPLTDENPRLVNQGGLFTRGPAGVTVEQWVASNFERDGKVKLWKVHLPEKDRLVALRSLNRMNINYLSLFPDLYGSSKHVNLEMLVEKY